MAIPALGVGGLPLTLLAAAALGLSTGVASAMLGALYVQTVDPRFLGRGDDVLMLAALAGFGALAAATSVLKALTVFVLTMAAWMFHATLRATASP